MATRRASSKLPGCYSSGDTAEEAMELLDEAIAMWVEVESEDGHDIPRGDGGGCGQKRASVTSPSRFLSSLTAFAIFQRPSYACLGTPFQPRGYRCLTP